MKLFRIALLIAVTGLVACKGGLDVTKTTDEARTNYSEAKYEVSLGQWQKLIEYYKSKDEEVPGYIYGGAGKAAMKLGDETQALKYFDKAYWAEYGDPEMYYMMAQAYLNMDNLTKEIAALEYYADSFPEGKKITGVKVQLFNAYNKSENWQLAMDLWQTIPAEVKDDKMRTKYFVVNRELGNEDICDDIAGELIKENPDNITALDYLADKYFRKAEERYQAEMKAYEENRTHKQYSKLLKALDNINANFKKALRYYEKLYKLTGDKKYAKSLGNIYTRFDDEKKADYYYRLSE